MGYVDYGRVSLSDGPTSTITVPVSTPSKPREPVSFQIKFCRAMVFVVVVAIVATITVVVVRKDKNTAFPVITTTTAAVVASTPSVESTVTATSSTTTIAITSAPDATLSASTNINTYTSATTTPDLCASNTTTVNATISQDFDDILCYISSQQCGEFANTACSDLLDNNWVSYVCADTCGSNVLYTSTDNDNLLQIMMSNYQLTCSGLQNSYCASSYAWYYYIPASTRAKVHFSCPETCSLPIVNSN